MVHPDNISKELVSIYDVSSNVQGVIVKAVDVGGDFNNKQEFDDRDSMLTWICRTATRLGFGVVIGILDDGSKRRNAFVTIKKWKFSVICGLHNHDLCSKLQGHPSLCRLKPEEKACISDMTLNLVQPKNILTILIRKEPDIVSNISAHSHSTYKTNKYILLLFEMVGITFTEKTYVVAFSFLECEKEDNFTWALEVFWSLLKDQVEMPKAIVTDRNTALMNAVANEKFVCAWTDNVRHLGNTTTNRVESAHASLQNWLGNSKGDLCRDWDFQYVTAWVELYFSRGEIVGFDSAECGSTISKTYSLPCACVIAKKMKLGEPIRMDEVIPHWKRLSFDDDGCMEGGKSNIFISTELEAIQEIFSKVGDNMKLHIKEQLRKIGYPETTGMKLPSQPVNTKDAPKKMKPTPNVNSITRSPSYCEHVDKLFPDSPTPKSQKSSMKGARICKPPPTPIPLKIPFIDEMSFLCTNTLSGSSMLRGMVIAVTGPFGLCSVNKRIAMRLSVINLYNS
ncbi:uncharacterized protein LOC131637452 [Vicia villosa]|uniref:uncharacterized protein LOC131637452 n=1 Tax=Vicia villosa TaxID=3911 RepID=UPI00273CA4B7|nr:uncharacterized protein LOC131637452 [Vicia villosa]